MRVPKGSPNKDNCMLPKILWAMVHPLRIVGIPLRIVG